MLDAHPDLSARQQLEGFEWSSTSLGPREAWPSSLCTLTEVVLACSFPMFLLWGPEKRLIYNDAYAPILGPRRSNAMGRRFFDVWPEVRSEIEPIVDQTYNGVGSYFENLPVVLQRFGYPEKTWFTFSYSPAVGEGGAVAGALCVCVETTTSVVGNERQAFLNRLHERLRCSSDPNEIIQAAQEELGHHLGVNRVGYGSVDPSERFFTTDRNWTDGSVPHHNGTHDLEIFGEAIHGSIKRGETLIVVDAAEDDRTLPKDVIAAFSALQIRSAVTVSLVKDERLVGALYVHQKEPRQWSEGEVETIEQVAEFTWSSVERSLAEARLRKSEERYRRIFEQTSDLIITATLDQVITDCNPAAAEAVGLSREAALGRKIAEFVSAEDFEQTSEMLRKKLQQGGTTRYDVRVRNRAGEWLYWEINSGLTTGDDGLPVELHVVGRDVTERKRAEERQRLLINELNHRVKNTLAIVQSIGQQTLRSGGASTEVQRAFEARLAALSAAHDVLTRDSWSSVSMRELMANALAPFGSQARFLVQGPDLRVNPQTAVTLALALHELATNASKYGALSNDSGTVAVTWTKSGERLKLSWRESGGPPVEVPSGRGFGSRMIERALAAELQGSATLRFDPEGLSCEVDAPLTSFA